MQVKSSQRVFQASIMAPGFEHRQSINHSINQSIHQQSLINQSNQSNNALYGQSIKSINQINATKQYVKHCNGQTSIHMRKQ
jgi:hypothetical protein